MVHGLLNDQEITCPICLETVASGEEVCPKENEEKEEYWQTNQPTYIFRWFFPGVLPRRCTQAMWSALRGGWLGLPSFVHHQLLSQTSVHVNTMATMFIVQFIIIWTVHTQERDLPGLQGASRRVRF